MKPAARRPFPRRAPRESIVLRLILKVQRSSGQFCFGYFLDDLINENRFPRVIITLNRRFSHFYLEESLVGLHFRPFTSAVNFKFVHKEEQAALKKTKKAVFSVAKNWNKDSRRKSKRRKNKILSNCGVSFVWLIASFLCGANFDCLVFCIAIGRNWNRAVPEA